jgi:uncharacterized protein YdaU (DUF1376 family)
MTRQNIGPYLPLYVDDFIGGTIHFGADEVGAYLLLLSHQWSGGLIEDDPVVIERVSRCTYDRLSRVLTKFERKEGFIFNRRLEAIRRERVAFIKTRSQNASRGWKKRKDDALAYALGNAPIGEDDKHARDADDRAPNGEITGANKDRGSNALAYAPGHAPAMHNGRIPSPSPYNDYNNNNKEVVVDLNGDGASALLVQKMVDRFVSVRPEFHRVRNEDIINALKNGPRECWQVAIQDFERDYAGALECPNLPHKIFAGYVKRAARGGEPAKTNKKGSKFT